MSLAFMSVVGDGAEGLATTALGEPVGAPTRVVFVVRVGVVFAWTAREVLTVVATKFANACVRFVFVFGSRGKVAGNRIPDLTWLESCPI